MSGYKLTLQHQCPQCGAPVSLAEDERVFSCPYCRVRLFVAAKEYVSYYVYPSEKNRPYCFFVPYWRFKGIEYQISATRVNHTIVDRTICARETPRCPGSLGYRQQAVPARFVEPATEGVFLRPQLSKESFLAKLSSAALRKSKTFMREEAAQQTHSTTSLLAQLSQSSDLSDQRVLKAAQRALGKSAPTPRESLPVVTGSESSNVLHAFIGETLSMIHWPFYFSHGDLYDGMTDKVLERKCPEVDFGKETNKSKGDRVRFLSTLCPNCGWSLEGAPDTLVLLCPRCASSWTAGTTTLNKTPVSFWSGTSGPEDLWLPFWRLSAEVSPLELKTQADLVRLLNLPRVSTPEMSKKELVFWIPAFKISPQVFLRLAGMMTIEQSDSLVSEFPEMKHVYPVTLAVSEAVESLPLLLLSSAGARRRMLQDVVQASFKPRGFGLAFVPFASRGLEYVQPELNFSVHRNALQWGRKL